MAKYFWEDFVIGETVEIGRRKVDHDEVVAFAKAFDPQPFHVDDVAAKASMFGGLIASGWHTCAMVMRRRHEIQFFLPPVWGVRDSPQAGTPIGRFAARSDANRDNS